MECESTTANVGHSVFRVQQSALLCVGLLNYLVIHLLHALLTDSAVELNVLLVTLATF